MVDLEEIMLAMATIATTITVEAVAVAAAAAAAVEMEVLAKVKINHMENIQNKIINCDMNVAQVAIIETEAVSIDETTTIAISIEEMMAAEVAAEAVTEITIWGRLNSIPMRSENDLIFN